MENTDQEKNNFLKKLGSTFSSENMSKTAKTIRGVASIIAVVGGVLRSPICPIVFAPATLWWIGSITLVSGTIAGVAQADTSKNGDKGIITSVMSALKVIKK